MPLILSFSLNSYLNHTYCWMLMLNFYPFYRSLNCIIIIVLFLYYLFMLLYLVIFFIFCFIFIVILFVEMCIHFNRKRRKKCFTFIFQWRHDLNLTCLWRYYGNVGVLCHMNVFYARSIWVACPLPEISDRLIEANQNLGYTGNKIIR